MKDKERDRGWVRKRDIRKNRDMKRVRENDRKDMEKGA